MIRRTVIAILLLNFVDLILTLIALHLAVAEELNPIMAAAYNISPLFFSIVKIGMVLLGCLLAWEFRKLSLVRKSLFFVLIVYVALVGWHGAMWVLFLRG